ncbi:DUF6345 domain-containing protein [Desulfolucanica intricata]|uniref:DUF6345 domain-containing protein n=1 Tax=Desulfolucanica intricata TaxID=1285191 RepID=UPI0008363DB9|nr:DUF6345 domain-containing protein [Desulfolucanica intricata]
MFKNRKCIFVIMLLLLVVPTSVAYADLDGSEVSIGVEYISNYTAGPGAEYSDPTTAGDAVNGLSDIVSDPNTSWIWDFSYGNSSARELDWKASGRLNGNDSLYTDNVDLNAFCGHGFGMNYVFTVEKNDWYTTVSDLDMGDRDCEWMLAFTCNFLNGTMANFGPIADGVHLVCGYGTDMTVTANAGSRFAYWAKHPYGVRVAWYKYGYDTQNGAWQNIARIFGANASYNDYLWGYGSVSSDPPFYTNSPSSYGVWDYKLNW